MANRQYINEEAAITWHDSAGTYAMTLNNLPAGTGRQGAIHDFGVAARALEYVARFWFTAATTPVVDETVRIYAKTSDGTHPDNDDGTGDIAVSAEDKLLNLGNPILVVKVDEAALSVEFVKSDRIFLPARYFMPVSWNGTADNFEASANVSGFSLTAVPYEMQT